MMDARNQIWGLLIITGAMAITAAVQIIRGVGDNTTWITLLLAALAAWRRGPSLSKKPDITQVVTDAVIKAVTPDARATT